MRAWFCALIVGALSINAAIDWGSQALPLPGLVMGRLPLPSQHENARDGDIRLHVTTRKGQVEEVVFVRGTPSLMADAMANLGTWRFAGDAAASFDVTYRYRSVPSADCGVASPEVILRLPSSIDVMSPRERICDPAFDIGDERQVVRQIRGLVRCRCPSEAPVAGAIIEVVREKDGRQVRTAKSDQTGHFDVADVPPGNYIIRFLDSRFLWTGFRITVSNRGQPSLLALTLLPAQTVPSEAFSLSDGNIPVYPEDARRDDVKGPVDLQMSFSGAQLVDAHGTGADPRLVQAAVATVRSWRFAAVAASSTMTRFEYRLLAGDCSRDRNELTVHLKLPSLVEVTSKRIVPCK